MVLPRQKKDARVLCIKLDRRLYDLLEGMAKANGDTKTELVEKILSDYLLKWRGLRLGPVYAAADCRDAVFIAGTAVRIEPKS